MNQIFTFRLSLLPRWWYECLFGIPSAGKITTSIGKARFANTMFIAPITLKWSNTGKVPQSVQLTFNNVMHPVEKLPATATSYVIPQVTGGDKIHFSVIENGQFGDSPPSLIDYDVPDLTPVAPAGEISVEIGEITEVPNDPGTGTTIPPIQVAGTVLTP